ncbi:hypothetical protein SAMN05216371_7378 [Streptomyces sp. TLI_053]|nr:hypothetical protein SAMN05216371_7378 [Streptomyces sp. TLI_053]
MVTGARPRRTARPRWAGRARRVRSGPAGHASGIGPPESDPAVPGVGLQALLRHDLLHEVNELHDSTSMSQKTMTDNIPADGSRSELPGISCSVCPPPKRVNPSPQFTVKCDADHSTERPGGRFDAPAAAPAGVDASATVLVSATSGRWPPGERGIPDKGRPEAGAPQRNVRSASWGIAAARSWHPGDGTGRPACTCPARRAPGRDGQHRAVTAGTGRRRAARPDSPCPDHGWGAPARVLSVAGRDCGARGRRLWLWDYFSRWAAW